MVEREFYKKRWHIYVCVYIGIVRGENKYKNKQNSIINRNTNIQLLAYFDLFAPPHTEIDAWWYLKPWLIILEHMTVNSEWGSQKQLQSWNNPNDFICWHDVLDSVTRLLFQSSLWYQELEPNMFTNASPWPRTYAYFKNKGHQIFVEFEHNRC